MGVTNHYYLARIVAKDAAFPVAPFWANQQTTGTHVNVSGAGVTAHARNRANAVGFLEFKPEGGGKYSLVGRVQIDQWAALKK